MKDHPFPEKSFLGGKASLVPACLAILLDITRRDAFSAGKGKKAPGFSYPSSISPLLFPENRFSNQETAPRVWTPGHKR
jgi:hypothetical protein